MKIYNNKIQIECDNIVSQKHGKIFYYYANNQKINGTMKIDFICTCGKRVITSIKAYKKDSRLLCKNCKTEQTNLEKYGIKNSLHSEKAKRTNLEKYGEITASKADIIKNIISNKNKQHAQNALIKRKQTLLEKYGVEYTFQIKEIKEKIKTAHENTYGGHPMNNDLIKEKVIRQHYYKYYKRLLERKDIQPLFITELQRSSLRHIKSCMSL